MGKDEFREGYNKGLEGNQKSVAEIVHEAIGTTPLDSERSDDYKRGLEQGLKDRGNSKK